MKGRHCCVPIRIFAGACSGGCLLLDGYAQVAKRGVGDTHDVRFCTLENTSIRIRREENCGGGGRKHRVDRTRLTLKEDSNGGRGLIACGKGSTV